MKKTIALILAFLMIFALFAGCGKKEETKKDPGATTTTTTPGTSDKGEEKIPGGESLVTVDKETVHPSADAVLKFAGSGEPSSLCFLSSNALSSPLTPISIFYDSLVAYDNNTGELVPCLATEWEWIDDVTLRFKLREDVKSHMGDPFTADDVVYSIKWGCSNTKCISTFGTIFDAEKCKAVDKYTVDVVLLAPNPFIIYELSKFAYGMVVEASVDKLGGQEAAGDNPLMATGPYKFTKWDKTNQVFYAERNEDYWGALPYYKYIEDYTVTDTTARCMGVEAGDYNSAQAPNANAVINAMGNKNIRTYITSGVNIMRWDLNSDREPLNIKEFRQALALAVNYDAIAQVSYSGYADTVDSVFPLDNAWHTAPADGEKEFYFYYDIDRAKEKMVEAGLADGAEIGLMFTAGKADVTAAVEILQNTMNEIGVKINVEQYESATVGDRRSKGDFDTILGGTINSSPNSALKQLDPRVGTNTGHQWIVGHETEIYDLIDKCKTTADMAKCFEYLAEFQDLTREYCPAIPVANQKNFNMTTSDIVNIAYDFSGTILPATFYPAEYMG